MPSGTGIAPPRCHPPPDGGTLRHVNNSLPGPVSEGSVHGNGSRQPDNWLSALADPFVTVLAHGNGVSDTDLLADNGQTLPDRTVTQDLSADNKQARPDRTVTQDLSADNGQARPDSATDLSADNGQARPGRIVRRVYQRTMTGSPGKSNSSLQFS